MTWTQQFGAIVLCWVVLILIVERREIGKWFR
jgi:hypothetical protein